MRVPVIDFSNSAVRCVEEPAPDDAKFNSSGRALASAMNSFTLYERLGAKVPLGRLGEPAWGRFGHCVSCLGIRELCDGRLRERGRWQLRRAVASFFR